jgi:hypothetical protein
LKSLNVQLQNQWRKIGTATESSFDGVVRNISCLMAYYYPNFWIIIRNCRDTGKPISKKSLFFSYNHAGQGSSLMFALVPNYKLYKIDFLIWLTDVMKRINTQRTTSKKKWPLCGQINIR